MGIKTSKIGKVVIDSDTLGELTNAALTITIDSGEKTAVGDSWKAHMGLTKSWGLSATCNYDPGDTAQTALQQEFMVGEGELASVKMYEDATKYYSGAAVITGFNTTKTINAMDTLALSFVGNGKLEYI